MAKRDTEGQTDSGGEGLAVDTPQTREARDAGRPTTTTFEESLEQGYVGSPADPRPNEDYTLAGQVHTQVVLPDAPGRETAPVV